MRQGSSGKASAKPSLGDGARKVHAKPPFEKLTSNLDGTRLPEPNRTAEAFAQYSAIAEILGVMSSSPGDVRPVLDAVAERAARLCEAPFARVMFLDGNVLRALAEYSIDGTSHGATVPLPITRSSISGRAVLDRRTVHHDDVVPLLDREYPDSVNAPRLGVRAVLAVPLMREDEAYGAIVLFRLEPRAFSPDQIGLVETFARQAAIAIDNARLFNETRERLEQQTATSEILRVISQSPTDVQPVFDAIAGAALKLCHASSTAVLTYDGKLMWLAALANVTPDEFSAVRLRYPKPPGRETAASRAILTGKTVVVPDALEDPDFEVRARSFRSVVSVPLVRDGSPIGAITVGRPEPGPFPDTQIALLKTFADQASIAIENVRLFNETNEALKQQTATSEILRVITGSPGDVQPMLNAVVERAAKLCEADNATIFLAEGDKYRSVARFGDAKRALELGQFMPLTRGSAAGRAIIELTTIHVEDVAAVSEDDYPMAREWQRVIGHRTLLAVPLLREERAIGALSLWRMEVRPFTEKQIGLVKTFADQAAIAVENVRLFTELTHKNRALTQAHAQVSEALERQTATSEVLRVISNSPTDVQPVFETIAASAARLCSAESAIVYRFDEEIVDFVAGYHFSPDALEAYHRRFPRPLRETDHLRRVLDGSVLNISDIEKDPHTTSGSGDVNRARGVHSTVLVPMLREDRVIGAIGVSHRDVGAFTNERVELLKTFANQAVIAVENARLFNETKQALERQTATSEILRVISQSPRDVQPVFDTIVKNAVTLCEARYGAVFRLDGGLVHLAAHHNLSEELRAQWFHTFYPMAPNRGHVSGRTILAGAAVQVPDILADEEYLGAGMKSAGFRSLLGMPLLRDGAAIGAIVIYRVEPGQFEDRHIELLKTFADQAVIAIENVRLFTELTHKNNALTQAHAQVSETLERQTATSEILRVISSTQTDLGPVFDAIVRAAVRLSGADYSVAARFDGEMLHPLAFHGFSAEALQFVERMFPMRPSRINMLGRSALTRDVVVIPDMLADPDYVHDYARVGGWRSGFAVPMLRDGNLLGVLGVSRGTTGGFPDHVVKLLQTFADQAVIAIENVRLLTELESRTLELTRSVGELKALGEIGQAVSSTLDLETVLSTIVSRATALAGMDAGAIYEYDEARGEFHLHTADRLQDEVVTALRAGPIRKGEGALGRMAIAGEPAQIRDIMTDASYQSRLREVVLRLGYRSLMAVPLMRDDHLLGGLVVYRKSPGEFDAPVIDLLRTFATQSALAIQNARLFREIEVKSGELETASRHKSEFLANMSHELRTPLNAIIGFSEVLSERMFGELNQKQAEYIGDILQSGQHLLSLINDILDLSKIEAGRMELELGEFDLPSTIENTLILVRERAQRRGIALTRAIDKRLGVIRGDERKLKQVLLNLLSNAVKFTPDGGQITVSAAMRDDTAEIAVTDTGVGISSEDQAVVFEEFRQVGTASKNVEGTGLGLAISRKFIELHGGRIWVKSETGSGSTFAFTLPLRRSSPA